jgi:hypothetical protein
VQFGCFPPKDVCLTNPYAELAIIVLALGRAKEGAGIWQNPSDGPIASPP